MIEGSLVVIKKTKYGTFEVRLQPTECKGYYEKKTFKKLREARCYADKLDYELGIFEEGTP